MTIAHACRLACDGKLHGATETTSLIAFWAVHDAPSNGTSATSAGYDVDDFVHWIAHRPNGNTSLERSLAGLLGRIFQLISDQNDLFGALLKRTAGTRWIWLRSSRTTPLTLIGQNRLPRALVVRRPYHL